MLPYLTSHTGVVTVEGLVINARVARKAETLLSLPANLAERGFFEQNS